MKTTIKHIKYKSLLISLFMLLFWCSIILRLFNIQVKNNDMYSSYSQNMAYKKKQIKSQRGMILDRNEKELAINTKNYSLAVHPKLIKNKKSLANDFAKILNSSSQEMEKYFNSNKNYVWINRDISVIAADTLRKLYKNDQAVVIEEKIKRKYPYNDLAGQTLGFTNIDNVGLEGLENTLEKQLSGIPGYKTFFRNGNGVYKTRPNLPYEPPKNGKNITLTIDIEYQNILHEEILNVQEKFNADKAMGILIDPNSGEILAMASAPVIDPNNYSKYPRINRKNILVTDVFEPGSTFKVITAAAALETGVVTPEDTVDTDKGYIRIQGQTIHDHERYPDMTFADVIRHSSNVGTIKIAQKMGTESLFNFTRLFGFGTKSTAIMPGEVNGIMKSIDGWTPLRTAQISMGQGISCTALQLIYAYAAIANGGLILQPQIVKSISDEDGKIEYERQSDIIRRVASEKTMSTIRELLLNTVETGTGSKAKVKGMDIAGKTGTSQKIKPGGGYSKTDYIASFVGFFPAKSPKLLCAVIVDNPRGGIYYGGSVSAPVVKNVFKRVVNMSQEIFFENDTIIPPVHIVEGPTKPDKPKSRVIYTSSIVNNKNTPEQFSMPNLKGKSLSNAIQLCNNRGLIINNNGGSGKVISQSPRKGKIVTSGTHCTVEMSIKRQ